MCSQARTRLIILTGGENNPKIKIDDTGQLAVGILPLDCRYTFIISENTERIDYLYGEGGGEKKGTGVRYGTRNVAIFKISHSIFKIRHSIFKISHSIFKIVHLIFKTGHSIFKIAHSIFKIGNSTF